MGVFSVDTSDKVAVFCGALAGISGGMAGAAAVLAVPGIVNSLRGRPDLAKMLSKPILKKFAALENEYQSGELTAANSAINNVISNLVPDTKYIMKLGRDYTKIAQSVVVAAGQIAESEFSLVLKNGKNNLDVAQVKINCAILQNTIEHGLNVLEGVENFEKQLWPQFQKEVFSRFDQLLGAMENQLNADRAELEKLLTFILQEHIPAEQVSQKLSEAYTHLKELRDSRSDLSGMANDVPEIAPLIAQADEALESGENFSLIKAEEALAQAETRYDEIITERDEQLARDRKNQFNIIIRRAKIAQTRSDYLGAAEHYAKAMKTVDLSKQDQFEAASNQASMLYKHGELFPGEHLALAAQIYKSTCLNLAQEDTDRAMIQGKLANTLLRLGERASGEEGLTFLRDAVAAYDLALEVYKRDTMPADWAMTQMNRAVALKNLGQRASGEEGLTYLHDAVAAYDLALKVYKRDTMPAQWAMTQMNRAVALKNLGQRASGDAGLTFLHDAVAAYDLALKVRERDTMPADWAATQMNRANALMTLGERASGEEGLTYLHDAVAAYDLALEVRERDTMPADWAATQMNRANALGDLGEKTGGQAGRAHLQAAIAGYDGALEIYGEPGMEYNADMTRNNRAIDLARLEAMDGD